MAFLTQISNQTHTPLKPVDDASIKDRSNANVSLAGKDVLDDEAERWQQGVTTPYVLRKGGYFVKKFDSSYNNFFSVWEH